MQPPPLAWSWPTGIDFLSGHLTPRLVSVQFISVQFILFAFINYSTKLHVIIIHLAGSPGSYFAYLRECLKKRSKKLECKLSMAEQNIETETK